jgi:Pectate lyase superfamily protein
MATLVQFLAAGVNGAQSGTATFLFRGSASSAASVLYNDFERTAQPGTNVIQLDANGAAEIYCSTYCDVTVRNAAGATLRTVTIGNSSGVIEVRSDSFRGDDYDGDPSNTANQPITLTNVLNLWNDSAGAPDFQVMFNGEETDLQTAFGNFPTSLFISVKGPAYNAQGDGVTDDTTAIQAALADANGAIVFFPPGIYITSSAITLSDANFHLMGSGFGSSVIRRTTAGNEIFSIADTTVGSSKIFEALGFQSVTSASLSLSLAPDVSIRDCSFDRMLTRSNSPGKVCLSITSCRFLVGGSRYGILNDADAGQSIISIVNSTFIAAFGYTGFILFGPDMMVRGCLFDASAVTTGTYYHVEASNGLDSQYVGTFIGNTFLDGGSDGYAFYLRVVHAGSNFVEDDNVFTGFVPPASLQDSGHIYDYDNGFANTSRVVLGSRRGKQLTFANATEFAIAGVTCFLIAETIVVLHTNASDLSIASVGTETPIGLTWNMTVLNESGAARDFGFEGTGGSQTETGVVDGGRAFGQLFTYGDASGVVCVAVAGTGDTSS